jgi:hypothetical protein
VLLRRVFSVKTTDPGQVMPGTVSPVYDVSDPYAPETRLDRGERTFGIAQQATNSGPAGNWQAVYLMNPVGSGKLCVVKRATWSLAIPTSATQGGFWGLGVLAPSIIGTFNNGAQGNYQDSRLAVLAGQHATAFGLADLNPGTFGSWAILQAQCSYLIQLNPGASAVPNFVHQVDQLGIALWPGAQCAFVAAGDTLPTANYTWEICVEGWERNTDPTETTVQPPA